MNAGERVYAAGQYFFPVFLMSEGGEVHPAVINKLLLIMRVYGVESLWGGGDMMKPTASD